MRYFFAFLIGALLSAQTIAQVKKNTPVTAKPATATVKKTATTPALKPATAEKETLVEITTDYGIMVAKLYNQTPLHRDNFIKLVKQGFYDSLLFHRVIKGFMIQGGDPDSKYAAPDAMVGAGSAPGNRVPAEFKNNFLHKKGALAAARDGNPEKASSNCQFYIVQGKTYDTAQLKQVYNQAVKSNNPGFTYTKAQQEIYERIGGAPFLDQNYTVFGEVISGLDVIDKIASIQTAQGDRPLKDIRMKVRLIN